MWLTKQLPATSHRSYHIHRDPRVRYIPEQEAIDGLCQFESMPEIPQKGNTVGHYLDALVRDHELDRATRVFQCCIAIVKSHGWRSQKYEDGGEDPRA
jgi:hypothetical protein